MSFSTVFIIFIIVTFALLITVKRRGYRKPENEAPIRFQVLGLLHFGLFNVVFFGGVYEAVQLIGKSS